MQFIYYDDSTFQCVLMFLYYFDDLLPSNIVNTLPAYVVYITISNRNNVIAHFGNIYTHTNENF